MPVPAMYGLVEDARKRFAEQGLFEDGSIKQVLGFGHLGDGVRCLHHPAPLISLLIFAQNLHFNVVAKSWDKRVEQAIEPWVYSWCRASSLLTLWRKLQLKRCTEQHAGSISAEHGLGLMKAPYVGYSKSAESIEAMRGVKRLFDPHGILNPYKVRLVCSSSRIAALTARSTCLSWRLPRPAAVLITEPNIAEEVRFAEASERGRSSRLAVVAKLTRS